MIGNRISKFQYKLYVLLNEVKKNRKKENVREEGREEEKGECVYVHKD